jgi:hypothetical protein
MGNLSQFVTSPSINSTVNDMLKYIRANITETDPAIKLAHQVTYMDAQGDTIGINWMLRKDENGGRAIFHSGQTGVGFTSLCVFYPEKNMGFIIFVNDLLSQNRLFDMEDEMRKNIK